MFIFKVNRVILDLFFRGGNNLLQQGSRRPLHFQFVYSLARTSTIFRRAFFTPLSLIKTSKFVSYVLVGLPAFVWVV